MQGLYLADLTSTLGVMVPIVALMIPIVAILVRHQQQMAQILHGSNRQNLPNPEVDSLRKEIQELKQLVHQQTIALDSAKSTSALPNTDASETVSTYSP